MRIFYTCFLAAASLCITNGVNAQSRAATFSFTYHTTADYTDFGPQLTDGEGGIADVPNVTYQLFYANAAGVTEGSVRFFGFGNHGGDDNSIYLDGREGYLYPIGQENSIPAYQFVVQTADGSEFSFKSVYLANALGVTAAQQNIEIIGYRNGVTTGQVITHADNAQFGLLLNQSGLLTPSVFQNVDKVVIRPTAGSQFPSEFWYGLNDIMVDDAVNITLPVRFLSFDARYTAGGTVAADWKTANEKDNSHFMVERSADGKTFADVARVDGKNPHGANYYYEDPKPLIGKNYYRITQYDVTGGRTASEIKMVNHQAAGTITMYPNPAAANGVITVTGAFKEAVQLTVLNAAGQIVAAKNYTTTAGYINLSLPAPGVYQVVVKTKGMVQSKKLVVVQ